MSAPLTPSRKTLLCRLVRALPQKGSIRGTISGWLTAHWKRLPRAHRPAEHQRQPLDAELLGHEPVLDGHVVPDGDVGEARPVVRRGVLLGEDDSPLPSMLAR